jgi:hypothetical protein
MRTTLHPAPAFLVSFVLISVFASAQTFDGSFPCGNLGSATQTGIDEYEITMNPDTGGTQKQWFYFSIADAAGRTLIIRVLDFDSAVPWQAGMTPCVSDDPANEGRWGRVPPVQVSFLGSDLTFSWTFATNDPVYFAYSFAYPYDRVQSLVSDLAVVPFVSHRILGQTLQGRNIDLLEIDECPGQDLMDIWIQARQHPAECGSSWSCEAFLLWLVGMDPAARALRRSARINVIPMINPDGVSLGNYRTNSLGLDLNRQWNQAQMTTAPSVTLALREIARIELDGGLDFFLDMHNHSQVFANFVYGVTGSSAFNLQEQGWAIELEDVYPDFSFSSSSFTNGDPGVAKNHIHTLYPDVLSYTHEQTYHTITYGPNAGVPVTTGRYQEMGGAIGEAMTSFLGYTSDLYLVAEPRTVVAGDLLSFSSWGGVPGFPCALCIVPGYFPIIPGLVFDPHGAWDRSGTVPAGFGNVDVTFRAVSRRPTGHPFLSNDVVVSFQ